jgi:hypothetical protein
VKGRVLFLPMPSVVQGGHNGIVILNGFKELQMDFIRVMLEGGLKPGLAAPADVAETEEDRLSPGLLVDDLRLEVLDASLRLFENVDDVGNVGFHSDVRSVPK